MQKTLYPNSGAALGIEEHAYIHTGQHSAQLPGSSISNCVKRDNEPEEFSKLHLTLLLLQ